MILAIDPGNEESAWCILENGALIAAKKQPNAEVLAMVRGGATGWQFAAPSRIAIEMIASYGMPVGREVFETCLWIGRFIEAWEGGGRSAAQLIYRREVKLFHCESMRATDANIRAALIDRYGPGKAKAIGTKKAPGPLYGLKGDEWSALAVALKAAA
jgi:hypothetical protein